MVCKRTDDRTQISAFDRADILCAQDMVVPVNSEDRIESARGHRRPFNWDQRNNDTGVEVGQQIGLAVEDESVRQTMNVELSHSELTMFLKRKAICLHPGI